MRANSKCKKWLWGRPIPTGREAVDAIIAFVILTSASAYYLYEHFLIIEFIQSRATEIIFFPDLGAGIMLFIGLIYLIFLWLIFPYLTRKIHYYAVSAVLLCMFFSLFIPLLYFTPLFKEAGYTRCERHRWIEPRRGKTPGSFFKTQVWVLDPSRCIENGGPLEFQGEGRAPWNNPTTEKP
ncbi:MAG: hypothetical protein ACPGO3_04890 [Magnetospiraceae bacterium]